MLTGVAQRRSDVYGGRPLTNSWLQLWTFWLLTTIQQHYFFGIFIVLSGLAHTSFHHEINFFTHSLMFPFCLFLSNLFVWFIYLCKNAQSFKRTDFLFFSFLFCTIWMQFSPLGHYFASASHDRTARIWSMDRIQPLRIMAGHLSDVDVSILLFIALLPLVSAGIFSSVVFSAWCIILV